jgi:hypothetical protein
MPVSLEHDRILLQAKGRSAEATEDGTSEYPEDPFSMARGMVNGVLTGLICWAVTLYWLMK